MPSAMNRRRFFKNSALASAGTAFAMNFGTRISEAPAAEPNGEWGNLKGRIVYDGKAPTPKKIKVDKDKECCGKYDLIDEALLVNPENGGLKNVIVYVYLKRGAKIPVHGRFAASEADDVLVNNEHCRFEPHVVLLRTTQQLVTKASDPIASNVKIDAFMNPSCNQTVPSGEEFRPKPGFKKQERIPVSISCPIHFWEKAWLVVRENPYMAVTDNDGNFEIKDLPAGEWTFQFWHEEAGYVDKVAVNGKAESWRRGRVAIPIDVGENDLGEIKVQASEFQH